MRLVQWLRLLTLISMDGLCTLILAVTSKDCLAKSMRSCFTFSDAIFFIIINNQAICRAYQSFFFDVISQYDHPKCFFAFRVEQIKFVFVTLNTNDLKIIDNLKMGIQTLSLNLWTILAIKGQLATVICQHSNLLRIKVPAYHLNDSFLWLTNLLVAGAVDLNLTR